MTLPEKTRSDHVEWIMNSDFGTVVENGIGSESPMKVQTQKSNSELEPEKVENDQVIEQNNNSDNQDLTEEIENEQIFEQNNKQKGKVKSKVKKSNQSKVYKRRLTPQGKGVKEVKQSPKKSTVGKIYQCRICLELFMDGEKMADHMIAQHVLHDPKNLLE